jgi:hypothetical protein
MKIKPLKDSNSVEFLIVWIFANVMGLLGGLFVSSRIVDRFWPSPFSPLNGQFDVVLVTNPVSRLLIVGFTVGVFIGVLERLVFRVYAYQVGWRWAASSIIIWVTCPAVGEIIRSSLQLQNISGIEIMTGVALGYIQWRVLRRMVHGAEWWILARAISGAFLFRAIGPAPHFEAFTLGAGIISGIVTGIALVYLLKHPLDATTQPTTSLLGHPS